MANLILSRLIECFRGMLKASSPFHIDDLPFQDGGRLGRRSQQGPPEEDCNFDAEAAGAILFPSAAVATVQELSMGNQTMRRNRIGFFRNEYQNMSGNSCHAHELVCISYPGLLLLLGSDVADSDFILTARCLKILCVISQ